MVQPSVREAEPARSAAMTARATITPALLEPRDFVRDGQFGRLAMQRRGFRRARRQGGRTMMSDEQKAASWYAAAAQDAYAEVLRARGLFPGGMHSAHEGFAVLLEEVDELKAHVWMSQRKRDYAAMRKEAIQVAAMALAFAVEVCDMENRT